MRKLVVRLTPLQARALFGAAVYRENDLKHDDSDYGRAQRSREQRALDRAMRVMVDSAQEAGVDLAAPI
jgi:hypothetical protein